MTLTYCSSEATAGHESFGCLNPDGHTGLHRASVTHGRCPNCGGIEDHADTCPTPDLMEDTSQPMQEVVWGDDGIARLEPYQYEPGRVPTYLLTQRSKVAATPEPAPPFTTDHLINHLRAEAQLVMDRGFVTRGQRLVIRDLLLRAAEEIESHDPR